MCGHVIPFYLTLALAGMASELLPTLRLLPSYEPNHLQIPATFERYNDSIYVPTLGSFNKHLALIPYGTTECEHSLSDFRPDQKDA